MTRLSDKSKSAKLKVQKDNPRKQKHMNMFPLQIPKTLLQKSCKKWDLFPKMKVECS